MNPLLFGSRARQLFGIHAPAAGQRQRRGVVLCAPWGQEYLRSQRSFKLLGDRLAQAGCDVLRFDYYGTGDSAGEGEDITLDGLVEDTLAAVEELQDLAQVRQVTLVGLRFGAAVAAIASGRVPTVDRLVLWDPISNGARYVDELTSDSRGEALVEVLGFPLTPAFREEASAVDVATFSSAPPETLLIVSEESTEHEELRQYLAQEDRTVDFELHVNPRCWVEEDDFGVGAVPADILDRIAAW